MLTLLHGFWSAQSAGRTRLKTVNWQLKKKKDKHLLCLGLKLKSSTLTHLRHLEAVWGEYMEYKQPLVKTCVPFSSYLSTSFVSFMDMWVLSSFPSSTLCTERFTKTRIFYTLKGNWICCTHFLPLGISDSRGFRDWLSSEEKLLLRYKQMPLLKSLCNLPFQLSSFYMCSLEMTLGWFQKIFPQPPQRKKAPYFFLLVLF